MFRLKLKELREAKGLSQQKFANIMNISQGTVGNWESGIREPNFDTMSKIANYFNVTVDYLLGNSTYPTGRPTGKGVKIPVLGRVQAGIPVEAIEDIIDYEEITTKMASQGEYFGLVIRGDSMEPKFSDGDVVIVRKQSDAETGDIVIALVNGDEATIKKIKKIKGGIMLVPLNPAFDTMFYDAEDIKNKPVTILGKVVELRAKF